MIGKLGLWLLATLVAIVACDLYFEYCVSRPCPEYLLYLLGVPLLVGVVLYLKYTVNLVIKLLKL
jgi:hypothetical protein